MALEEEPATVREVRRASDCLRACPAFAAVQGAALDALAQHAVQFCLPTGALLFEAGAAADGFYVLASGRLGIRASESPHWRAVLGRGEIIGETGWLLKEAREADAVALRDSELLWLTSAALDALAASSSDFALAMARSCARRLRGARPGPVPRVRPRVFAVLPNSIETGALDFACALIEELSRSGRAELIWDVRASTHTAEWFSRLEEANDYVVYLAESSASGWTRQCCRQADLALLVADARCEPRPWAAGVLEAARGAGLPVELALLHENGVTPGAASRWLPVSGAASHHHIIDGNDIGRLARLITRRGVGLVFSGGGARGFAHVGIIRALREARIPIDFVGGVSIGSIIAAGVASGWTDAEMRRRYRRSFVDTNPVSDYTFPFVALTRGRKVTALLRREFTDVHIEDLRLPFFCLSASLSTGRAFEHRAGPLWQALRASVAIPGVLPPVFLDEEILVDGAAINNLPVDTMQRHAPGLVIGCDVGADRALAGDDDLVDQPPFWRFFSRARSGRRRINIFQILMRAGIINGASTAAAQRELADILLKPTLENVDLLNWQAFDRAIDAGYAYARGALEDLPQLPRLDPVEVPLARADSLAVEILRRLEAAVLTATK
jgi:NTE family protein